MQKKLCNSCGFDKEQIEFGRKNGKDFAYPICKVCARSRAKLSRKNLSKRIYHKYLQEMNENPLSWLWGIAVQLDRLIKDMQGAPSSHRISQTIEMIDDPDVKEHFEIWLLVSTEGSHMLALLFQGSLYPMAVDARRVARFLVSRGFRLPSRPTFEPRELPEFKPGIPPYQLGLHCFRRKTISE